MLNVIKELPKLALLEVLYLYDQYPARFIATTAAAVVYVARTQGIVLDEGPVKDVLGEILVILAAGAATHRKVKPAHK